MNLPDVLELRGYQEHGNDRLRGVIRSGCKDPCMCSPTGSGKTAMVTHMLMGPERQTLLTPRRILLEQTARFLTRFGVEFGVRASGYPTSLGAPIQIGMIDTEYSRAHKGRSLGHECKWPLHDAEIVHIDEIHTQTGPRVQRIRQNYIDIGASVVGWTATPRDIGHLCSELIEVTTVSELIRQGFLVEPIVFGPDMPDTTKMDKVKRQANGDFSVADLKKVWSCGRIFANVLRSFIELNVASTPAILFAQGVRESQWFAERFTENGIRAAHVDGSNVWIDGKQYKSDREARDAVFAQVEDGSVRVLCNRFVLREGFDLPCIGHVILACAFGSRAPFVQAVGRALRPYPGRTNAIIQDHGGNWLRLPAIDSDTPWELGVSERVLAQERIEMIRSGTIPEPINCPKCNAIRPSGDTCPVCHYRTLKKSRPVVQVDGTLKLVDGPAYRKRRIVRTATDVEDWEKAFWAAQKNTPERTLSQVYAYFAKRNNWRWLPRDLKFMPKRERHWFVPIRDLEFSDLLS